MCLSSGLQIQSKGTVFTNIKSPVGTIWSYLFIARFKSYVIISYKIYICVCIHVCPWKPGNGVPSSPIFFLRNPDLCSAYPLYELTGKQIQDTYVFSCSFEVLKKKKKSFLNNPSGNFANFSLSKTLSQASPKKSGEVMFSPGNIVPLNKTRAKWGSRICEKNSL